MAGSALLDPSWACGPTVSGPSDHVPPAVLSALPRPLLATTLPVKATHVPPATGHLLHSSAHPLPPPWAHSDSVARAVIRWTLSSPSHGPSPDLCTWPPPLLAFPPMCRAGPLRRQHGPAALCPPPTSRCLGLCDLGRPPLPHWASGHFPCLMFAFFYPKVGLALLGELISVG